MKKLGIVYFYQYFGTPKGGWSTRVYEMGRRWVAEGHSVTVITTPYDKSDIAPFKGLWKVFYIEGIKVIVLNFRQSNKDSTLRRVIQFVKYLTFAFWFTIRLKYDLAIASSGPISVGILGIAAKLFRRKKFVFEVRDLWPSGAIQLGIIKNRNLRRAAYRLELLCYNLADLIVCASEGMKQDIERRFAFKHIIVVPNACDTELFSNYDKVQKNIHEKWIVYTGSLGVMDDCMQIMYAIHRFNFNKYPYVRFLIAGEGIDRARMEAYKAEHFLDQVDFTGLIPKSEVVDILGNAYCSVVCFKNVPVLNTVSPNKMFDAFAAGVPVVQTTQGWIAELVEYEKCGINVLPDDPESMVAAIEEYLDHPQLQKQHGENAKKLAITTFSRDACAQRMITSMVGLFEPEHHHNHIWIINQFAGHEQSGWGERHYYMSKFWQEKGYRVSIISGSFNHMFLHHPKAPKTYNFETHGGTDFVWVKTPTYDPKSVRRFWSMLVFAWRVNKLPVKKIGKPDYIVVSSMPIFPIVFGPALKRRYGAKKLIFEIRDIWPLTLIELGEVSPLHPIAQFIGWFERFGYRNSDHIVTLLPYAAKHIVAHGGQENKVVYIPNGLEEEVLVHEQLAEEVATLIPSNKFIIGYTGTHSLANALEYLVESARLLQHQEEYYFILVGEGYKKPQLKAMAASLNNILFVDKLPKNQMQDLISRFDICFVGRQNSKLFDLGVSGNKYFDYMLASKPIIDANNSPGSPAELAGACVRVRAESADAIVAGILSLRQMTSEQRAHMGFLGKQYLEANHRTRLLADRYISLFSQEASC